MIRSEKQKKTFPFTIVRRIVQVVVLIIFLVPVLLAGWNLFGGTVGGDTSMGTPSDVFIYGSLTSSSIFGVNLLDPFAFLQYVVASKSLALDALIAVLPVLVFYGLIRGRAFCGWTCPVNLLLEIVDFLRVKLHIKVEERVLPRHAMTG